MLIVFSGQVWYNLFNVERQITVFCDDGQEKQNYVKKRASRFYINVVYWQIIINVKQELIRRNLYSFEKYTSLDVYDAVINYNIINIKDFLENYKKKK
ncbi:MAG: hypothetical protein HFH68_12790 [Lachnospiraceae bacterium]|nr:hypothetical protein [Lachnospiraceae bacterium]